MPQLIGGISHFDKAELHAILQDPASDIVVIDVREPFEYEAAHIPGVPLIPMGEIPYRLEELDPEQEYVLVCRSGSRSYEVARYLQAQGFTRIHNFLGGMLGWDLEVTSGLEEDASH
ncbi:putative adenylyltransferase/sulfurtransferase MoeZ [compost metagenome]|jgi:rhodanese-related sulfurtransferase|uniref:Rhodanese-like domain-containing protein n=1 Tax=Paenibacillus rhizolycopersici TaxID=2780073 RepID=A0ABS2GZP3_9BACL|nr:MULTISPECIES: rhodanese-like domain-containing protein [Paenibacillus]MBM6994357.1 rhodanese-like domain-containing protein [Paenibacillus rhizolycopersici]MUG86725.1 rhodanese-like domain-containing protein [Paenibacillus timonensis]GIP49691.1 sulfurtransferase [Paenibacillus sp. J53TS2]